MWVKRGSWRNNWITGHPGAIPADSERDAQTERRNVSAVSQRKAPWNSMMRSRYE